MSIDLTFHQYPTRRNRVDEGLTTTLWRVGPGHRAVASAMLGGGIGRVAWVINAQVPGDYARMDPVAHLAEMADDLGLHGRGVGMLTAAAVSRTVFADDGGVCASATVGLRVPTWAAAPAASTDAELAPMVPGTVNITVDIPVPLTDGALVNAVMTVTEAKAQALIEAGYSGTGTASDAVVVVVPVAGAPEVFAGPRSRWGAATARAVHAAVRAGADDYTRRLRDGGL